MRADMGDQRRSRHGHFKAVGFGAAAGGGAQHVEHDQEKLKDKKLDMSGLSMDTIPHITMSLGHITTLDLSNNNLEVCFVTFSCVTTHKSQLCFIGLFHSSSNLIVVSKYQQDLFLPFCIHCFLILVSSFVCSKSARAYLETAVPFLFLLATYIVIS
jgi:hypothetical protein